MKPPRRWTNTRILGACGLSAAALQMVGGWIGGWWPRVGAVVVGAAGAVMLAANLVLLLRKEP